MDNGTFDGDAEPDEGGWDFSPSFLAGVASTPRGLESYVPALALLRIGYWSGFSAQLRAFLEVADYVGFESARKLTIGEFEDLWYTLPGFIWSRAADTMEIHRRERAAAMFIDEAGRPLTSSRLFQELARGVTAAD